MKTLYPHRIEYPELSLITLTFYCVFLHQFTLLQISLHIHKGIVFDQPNISSAF